MEGKNVVAPFGAKACAKLIAMLAFAYVLLNLGLGIGIDFLHHPVQWSIIRGASDIDLKVLKQIASSILSPLTLTLVTLVVLKKYFPLDTPLGLLKKFGFEGAVSGITLAASFVVGVSLILFIKRVLMEAFPPNSLAGEAPSAVVEQAQFWAQILYVVNSFIMVPLTEEFLFRGVLYKGFSLSWNKISAAALVSLIFTLGHIDTLLVGYWVSQLALVLIPIVFVIAREITGSLYSPILIHSGFNFGSIFL